VQGRHISAFPSGDDILISLVRRKNLANQLAPDLKSGHLTAPALFALEENPT